MRAIVIAALLASGTAFATQPAPSTPSTPAVAANTVVSYVHPEKFFDASDIAFGMPPSQRMLDRLTQIFVTLGTKYLAPDQTLKIEVTDVDLAGRFETVQQPGTQVRVLREHDWPRIDLHYALAQNGLTAKQADAQISDMNYLGQQLPGQNGQSLSYEQRMLDRWFAKTFGTAR